MGGQENQSEAIKRDLREKWEKRDERASNAWMEGGEARVRVRKREGWMA